MTVLASWISPGVLHSLGWALIHFLWQGTAVAALTAALMALCRRPSARYAIGTGALAVMLAAPVGTFLLLNSPEALSSVSLPVSLSDAAISLEAVPYASVAAATNVAAKTAAIPSPRPIFAWQNGLPWLVGAWLFGVTIFSLRFAGGFLLLDHKRRRHSSAPSAHILKICREMQRQLGLKGTIGYLECNWLQTPAVIGWIRPIILLPVVALTGFSEEQWRAVIAHELAHIRRLDSFVNLFQILVETLLFYHPAIWWLNKRIRSERELCCDEIAVSLCGNPRAYARALALMEEWRSAPVLAMAANCGSLSERVLYVLDRQSMDAKARILGLTGGVVFLFAALAAGSASLKIAYPIAAFGSREISGAILPPADFSQTRTAPPVDRVKNTVAAAKAIASVEPQAGHPIAAPSLLVSAAPNPSPAGEIKAATAPADQAISDGAARAELTNQSASIASASAAPVMHEPQVTPALVEGGQPSGIGDPNTTVCRKPEPGSNGSDQICMKNSYWFALWIRGKSLGADGRTILEPANAPMLANATGEGDPDQVVCQMPRAQTASRLLAPTLCFRNLYWARLKHQSHLLPGLLSPVDEKLISELSRG